jgi:uncharacterized protein (DUF433 family)
MNTAASSDPRIEQVRVTEDESIAQLVDGRVISVPLAWSRRLAEATAGHPRVMPLPSPRPSVVDSRDGKGHPMEIRHYKFQRITLDPNKCFGKPCIRGLRMPVASVLSYLSSGMAIDEVLAAWPELEREDVYEALGYAAWAMEERIVARAEAEA